jgi:Ni/Co efflux regulator RcnB
MRIGLHTARALIFVIGGIWAVSPVFADKPEGKGGGQHDQKGKGKGKNKHDERGDNDRNEHKEGRRYFEDRHANYTRDYYGNYYTKYKKCPPGLAKKNNGCMPPGQAKWERGRPLPREVVYYDVPQPILVQLPPPPRGDRYVRVGGDILLIAIGTRMVIDGMQGLSGR